MRSLLVIGVVALMGCQAATPDACAPFSGRTCIALTIKADTAGPELLDQLGLEGLAGFQLAGGNDARTPATPASFRLPVTFAVVPAATFSGGAFTLRIVGYRDGQAQATAELSGSVAPGAHVALPVLLSAGTALDLGMPADLASADLAPPPDLSATPDLSSPPDLAAPPVLSAAVFSGFSPSPVPTGMLAADITGDGKADLVWWSGNGYNKPVAAVAVGDGTFISPLAFGAAPSAAYAAAGDFNGDSRADVVTVNLADGVATVHLSNGNGTFSPGPIPDGGITSGSTVVAVADVNGDGKLDIVQPATRVAFGEGGGVFSPQVSYPVPSPGGVGSTTPGDYNGDTHTDVALLYGNPTTVGTQLGSDGGLGMLVDSLTLAVGSPAMGFFDGDTRADLVVIAYASNAPTSLALLRGQASGGFAGVTTFASGLRPGAPAVGDLDGDGKLDVVAAIGQPGGTGTFTVGLSIFYGDGAGQFPRSETRPLDTFPAAYAVGDVNGDGKLDVIAAYVDASTSLRLATFLNVRP